MAGFAGRPAAILKALSVALRRDQKSILSLTGNHFFIVSVFVLAGGGVFIYLIIGLVILFPLSTDPLRRIPASRISLWPLDRREWWILRAVSPWLNPVTWAIAALAVWAVRGKVTAGLWALAAGLVAAGFVLSSLQSLPFWANHAIWRRLPNFPGPLNQLVRKNLRGMFTTLDVYCGLLLSGSMLAFRLILPVPRDAFPAITILVVATLSSYAQCLFGLDGRGGLSRYRLLPVRGWQVLAAKDAAFLLVAIVLTLPLAPAAGLGAALMALAFGHRISVEAPRPQVRWRFSTGGTFLPYGLVQVAAMALAAAYIFYYGVWFLALAIAAWIGSLWWYGKSLERTFVERAVSMTL